MGYKFIVVTDFVISQQFNQLNGNIRCMFKVIENPEIDLGYLEELS